MTPGKLASQAGHAFTDVLWECLKNNPDLATDYQDGPSGSKVVLSAKNLHQLERAARECADAGIPVILFEDSGHVQLPHFDGLPVITALGAGPCTHAQVRHIMKRFGKVP